MHNDDLSSIQLVDQASVEHEGNVYSEVGIVREYAALRIVAAALTVVLGRHVKVVSVLADPGHSHVDFTHHGQMHHEEILEVEKIVNDIVMRDLPISVPLDEREMMALIGCDSFSTAKDSVISFSEGLDAGACVHGTSEAAFVKIARESSNGHGIRRVEILTGIDAYEYVTRQTEELCEAGRLLGCANDQVAERVGILQERQKERMRSLKILRESLAMADSD